MGTVHHLPPRLRLVDTTRSIAINFRDQQICEIARHAANATSGLIDAARSEAVADKAFIEAQYELEAALFHSCCLNGARQQDRELTTLLLKRKQEREGSI